MWQALLSNQLNQEMAMTQQKKQHDNQRTGLHAQQQCRPVAAPKATGPTRQTQEQRCGPPPDKNPIARMMRAETRTHGGGVHRESYASELQSRFDKRLAAATTSKGGAAALKQPVQTTPKSTTCSQRMRYASAVSVLLAPGAQLRLRIGA